MFHMTNAGVLEQCQMVKLFAKRKSGKSGENMTNKGERGILFLIVIAGAVVCTLGRPVEDKLMVFLKSLSDEELQILEDLVSKPMEPMDEEMLGDQPQPINMSSYSYHNDRISRDREQRLWTIKQQVLQFAGRDGKSNSTQVLLSNQQILLQQALRNTPWSSNDKIVSEKLLSFLPTCEVPRNTDEEIWDVSQAMNLYFDLTCPAPAQGLKLSIKSAKLRLFKKSLCYNFQPETDGNYSLCPSGKGEEPRIRVSVYYYKRSLKKQKVKKRLSDSQMLSFYGDEWTELDVKAAVNTWRESGKNFGIAVEVEDEDRNILPAAKYFSTVNCSAEAINARPTQSYLAETNSTELYPTILLRIIEYSEPDLVHHQAVRYPITEGHRIRHHHHHHRQLHSTPVNDSMEKISWDDPTISSKR